MAYKILLLTDQNKYGFTKELFIPKDNIAYWVPAQTGSLVTLKNPQQPEGPLYFNVEQTADGICEMMEDRL